MLRGEREEEREGGEGIRIDGESREIKGSELTSRLIRQARKSSSSGAEHAQGRGVDVDPWRKIPRRQRETRASRAVEDD